MPPKIPMADLEMIERRLAAAKDDVQLSNVIRDVEAHLAVEHADAIIIEAVEALAHKHRLRIYGGVGA